MSADNCMHVKAYYTDVIYTMSYKIFVIILIHGSKSTVNHFLLQVSIVL